MYVDGGAITQVFLYPSALSQRTQDLKYRLPKQRNAYIIRNPRLDTEWLETVRRTLSIIHRAISSLIQTQVDGVGFNLAFIGPDFKFAHKT